jgi:hypothetical protein
MSIVSGVANQTALLLMLVRSLVSVTQKNRMYIQYQVLRRHVGGRCRQAMWACANLLGI